MTPQSLQHRYQEAETSEHPRFDPLRNKSIERSCAIQERRIREWREISADPEKLAAWGDRVRSAQQGMDAVAKVCPKR